MDDIIREKIFNTLDEVEKEEFTIKYWNPIELSADIINYINEDFENCTIEEILPFVNEWILIKKPPIKAAFKFLMRILY